MEISPGIRQKLALLLAGEDLESPQQLLGWDDSAHRNITSWEMFQRANQTTRDRKARYREYQRMNEMSSDIAASLDSFAEEAVLKNRDKDRSVWAVSDNKGLVDDIHELLDKLNIEEEVYGIARNIAMMGDEVYQLYYAEPSSGEEGGVGGDDLGGVFHWKYTEPWRLDMVRDDQARLRGWRVSGVKGYSTATIEADAKPWDFVLFKSIGSEKNGWGESLLSGVVRTWRILDQIETALALYRLHRAADRIIFYVDIGSASQDAAYDIVNKWKQMYRKRKWYDASKQEIDFKHNPIDLLEDIFWPTSKESQSKVDKLQGSNNVGDIADIEMWRNKLRYGLRIPKGYWGDDDGGVFDAKAGLVQQDIKFARGVARIQRAIINGITKIVQIHLAIRGQNPNAKRFKIRMEPVSYLDEMQRLETLQQRVIALQGLVEVGQALGFDPDAWAEYLMKTVMFTSDDELNEFFERQAEVVAQKQKDQADLEQKAAENEVKGQEIENKNKQSQFAKEKADAKQRASKPGGQSGAKVTVNINSGRAKATTGAKKKKTRMSDDAPERTNLLEEDLANTELEGLTEYLASNKDKLAEIKAGLNKLRSNGIIVDLS